MKSAAEKLRRLRGRVSEIAERADGSAPAEDGRARRIRETFRNHMDRDLEVKGAFDDLFRKLEAVKPGDLKPAAAISIITVLREIDRVLNVIF